MTHSYSRSSQLTMAGNDKDQAFSDVIAAISEGKYSWACVLMLRSAGYNPLHYMPYRTYNRIIKANLNLGGNRATKQAAKQANSQNNSKVSKNIQSAVPSTVQPTVPSARLAASGASRTSKAATNISDLPHLDPAAEGQNTISGGRGSGASTQASAHWWKSLIHQTWH